MSDDRADDRPPSRRRALQVGAGAVAVAWAAPAIVSVPAAAQTGSVLLSPGPNIVADPGFDLPG